MSAFCSFPLLACSTGVIGDATGTGPVPVETIPPERAQALSLEHVRSLQMNKTGVAPATDLVQVRAVAVDALGQAHTRIAQTFGDIPVFGGEAIVHLSPKGDVRAVSSGLIEGLRFDPTIELSHADAVAAAVEKTGGWGDLSREPAADLQILRHASGDHLTYRVQLAKLESAAPSMPVVFVSAKSGEVIWQYDNLQTARSRRVHNLNHGTTLPGPLARSEGGAPSGDVDVDTNYDRLGSTYDCYSALFNRDSFDNAGATLISSVHYSNNYVNAYWDGTQMVYGDGDNVNSRSLAISMDVTAHELTHAVTERTSNLIYSGESGGLNEAMSDIFGNVCEWYRDNNGNIGAPASNNNWLVGEDIWLAAPALRFMNDPAADGVSLDYWTSSAGNVDVHYSSGIANLAFHLLSAGGTHPRGRSTINVTGIGIHDAGQIFYRANTVYLTPSSNFGAARQATINAATDLFGAGSAQVIQTGNAWTAVGVAAPPNYVVIDTRTGLSGATGSNTNFSYPTNGATAMRFVITGGTGDADLYVRFGAAPTTTAYDCRPFTSGNNETCEFNPAQSGTYFVMIRGYSAYSGVTLTVSAAGAGGPTTETSCTDGVDNDSDGFTDCADSDCAQAPSCQTPTTETSCTDGVDNDADGFTDCADSDCAQAPSCQSTSWVTISTAGFETSFTPYTDGGGDCARFNSATNATSGVYSVQIRDNSGSLSSFYTTTGMNLSAYSEMRISYGLYALGMEVGEDYLVEVWNGSAWAVVADYFRGTDFNNSTHYTDEIVVPLSSLASRTAVRVRFRADGSDNSDQVFIDDVVISAR